MNILIAPNNYYTMPTIVLLQSLFKTAEEKLDIYVIHSDLTDENIHRLESFISNHGGQMHLITIDARTFGQAHTSIHITKEAYYRLLAQTLLPQDLDRVLYLDGDIIVTGSLKGLYEMSFFDNTNKENYFIVCEGPGVSKREWTVYDNLNIPHEYPYFNSGVLLMNLSLLRRSFNPQHFFDFIQAHGANLKYHDQDTLNALFYDKVIYADRHIYNQTVLCIKDANEANMRLKSAAVIHYAGSDKPWKHDYKSWYFHEFWRYACLAGYRKLYTQIVWKRFWWHLGNKFKR